MNQIINNLTSIATELVVQKTIKHKPGGILKTALSIIDVHLGNCVSVDYDHLHDYLGNCISVESYKYIFNFLDFDSFAQIKELYSSNVYKFIPSWDEYFKAHNIKRHHLKTHLKKTNDSIRLIFIKISSAKSMRDDQMRTPYWINLDDIDHAGYYKLMKFLILSYYTINERINATSFSVFGQKAALETNAAFVLIDGRRIKSIEQCITEVNEEALVYLVEQLEMKPSWNQLNRIEKIFSSNIVDMITYYFE